MHALDKLTAQEISKRLQPVSSHFSATLSFDVPSHLIGDQFRDAAVLIPFVRLRDEWHLLYIRRARSERDRHSGQVAFAGGKRDPQDTDLYRTALREARITVLVISKLRRLLGKYLGLMPYTYSAVKWIVHLPSP
jgi:hypothetical protein